jgi:2-polyprenyl-3-methyl-5-hydroxy-6-metoxy-1,4-benzoquinol methylase
MLADALGSLLCSPEKMRAMREAARVAVEINYNWDTVSNQLAELFQESIWKSKLKPRLGTLYRDEMLNLLNKRVNQGKVLDVGCHDGYWLSKIEAPFRVGVDLDPIHGVPSLSLVCADGRKLPFVRQSFDQVYALDVIEHIQEDRAFADTLSQVIKPGGNLFLSTPSLRIKLFPAFLTRWISLKWGHDLRLGYEPDKLIEYFKDDLTVGVRSWNAPAYRFLYLPLRFLSSFAPKIAANLVRRIARWDYRHQEGNHGFYLLEGVKPS